MKDITDTIQFAMVQFAMVLGFAAFIYWLQERSKK